MDQNSEILKYPLLLGLPSNFNKATPEEIEEAIKYDPTIIKFFIDKTTPEIKKLAIASNGLCLKYLDLKNRSKTLCDLALMTSGEAFKYFPKKYRTYENAIKAIKVDPLSIEHIDENLITKELCMLAIKKSGLAFPLISSKFLDQELCDLAISKSLSLFNLIPDQYRTYEMIMKVLSTDGNYLIFVKDQTPDICLTAINSKEDAYIHVNIVENPDFVTTKKNLENRKIILEKLK